MAQEYINRRPCERQLLRLSQRKLNGKTKVRAENMQQACDLVVNHLGCDICDMRKFVFYPKKYSQFHRLNLHISLYLDCLLLLSSEWSWNSYCSSICSCPQHVVKWPHKQVGLKQLFMIVIKRSPLWFSDDSE